MANLSLLSLHLLAPGVKDSAMNSVVIMKFCLLCSDLPTCQTVQLTGGGQAAPPPSFFLVLSMEASADPLVDEYVHSRMLIKVRGVGALAGAMDADTSVLSETLRAYQKAAVDSSLGEGGRGDEFGRAAFSNPPGEDLDEETFYIGKVSPILLRRIGGVVADANGDVLDKVGGEILPGLHAVGEIAADRAADHSSPLHKVIQGWMVGVRIPVSYGNGTVPVP